jgi:chondroitin 4-sulfotransferase 11
MRDLWRNTKNELAAWREKYWRSFVFIHINKTAGSSIEKALGLRFGHETAGDKIERMGTDRWASKFSFAFVRNPWDRAVSHYHYRVRSNQHGLDASDLDFRSWIRQVYGEHNPAYRDNERMFMPQRRWLTDSDDRIAVSYVGRYEHLQSDFDEIRARINRGGSLPQLKQSGRSHYRDYYDHHTRDIVADAFEEDIRAFDYSFD